MPTLEDAIALAVDAHRGQVDKAGQPYVLHSLRVMLRLEGEAERTVAVLHDLVEDTRYTFDDLRAMGYSGLVLEALDCVTHRQGDSYDDFIERVKPNPIARRVKLADLEDNLDVRRLASITDRDVARLQKYLRVLADLRQIS